MQSESSETHRHLSILEVTTQLTELVELIQQDSDHTNFIPEMHFLRQLLENVKRIESSEWQQFELNKIQQELTVLKLNHTYKLCL